MPFSHTAYLCFARFLEQRTTVFISTANQYTFAMDTCRVFFAAGTEFLNGTQMIFVLQSIEEVNGY